MPGEAEEPGRSAEAESKEAHSRGQEWSWGGKPISAAWFHVFSPQSENPAGSFPLPFASEAVSGICRGLNQGPISSEWKFLSLEFSGATRLLAFSLPGVQLRFSLENSEVLRSLRRYRWGMDMKTHTDCLSLGMATLCVSLELMARRWVKGQENREWITGGPQGSSCGAWLSWGVMALSSVPAS